MKGIPQTKDLNPARPGIDDGFYFSMPGFSKIDLSANTNNWGYSDLIHKGMGQRADSLVFDLNKFTSALGETNFINESTGFTFLEGGFKSGKNFFALSYTEKEVAELFFHKNLVKLINYGNYPYIGSSFRSGSFGINAQHYRELAFLFSREMDKKITLGVSAKILFGLGAVHTNGLNFTVASPPNGSYLDLTASGKADISAPVEFRYNGSGAVKSVTDDFEWKSYLTNFSNPGLAVDLGISYRANKKLELSASLIDIGIIAWNDNTTRFNELGQFRYKGIKIGDPTVSDLEDLVTQVSDSLNNKFSPAHSGKSFSTFLPIKLYLGGEYSFSDKISLAGLARIRAFNNYLRTSFTASANMLIWKGLSLSGTYSIMESTLDNLGAGIGFRGGPFQLYAASDNIFSPFYPSQAKNMNLRLGINFIFSDRQKEIRGKTSKHGKKDCGCPY